MTDFPNHEKSTSPFLRYELLLGEGLIKRDPAQYDAVLLLDELWKNLVAFKKKRNRFLGKTLRSPDVPKGVYLYGGVGRGKSFLMDLFYDSLPYRRKRRVHFHAFMAEVHARLKTYHGRENPLALVAADIAREVRVLCFDEFHVSDIADAMILGRLLEGLFAHGIVMVATSNYAPADLYPKGQNRLSFLPAIELLETHMEVLNVDSGTDYRRIETEENGIFFIPADAHNEQRLQHVFTQVSGGAEPVSGSLRLWGRDVPFKGSANGAVWFDFDVLCRGMRSQNDYLEIAKMFHTVLISGIPKLSAAERNEARRLTWLVDVFYDCHVKLYATADVIPDDIYTAGDFAGEFIRTASRLTEMQEERYLSLPYRAPSA